MKISQKRRKYLRSYQIERYERLRYEWFSKNGPCSTCGSNQNLLAHHIDPSSKITHRFWSYSKNKRETELAKCILLEIIMKKMLNHSLNDKSIKILNSLIKGIPEPGEGKKIANSSAFMPVHVAWLWKNTFHLAHYYEQNGDLVPDPEMHFYRDDGKWYPTFLHQGPVGRVSESVDFGHEGEIVKVDHERMAEMASFADMWLENIKQQQELVI